MGIIRIIAPPRSLYTFGPVMLHDMERRTRLCRIPQGSEAELPADSPIDLGVAWGRGSTPPVKLRFTAHPGRIYMLYWLAQGFGAGMGVMEQE